MNVLLPESIITYYDISNGADDTRLSYCFTKDAVVLDEGRTHQGHKAIQSWLHATRKKFKYTVEPISATQEAQTVTVTTAVTGTFPGSPIQLKHLFQLSGDKIQSLEIH